MATMHAYADQLQVPLPLLRLIADSPGLCEAFSIEADHHYMDKRKVTSLTTRQYQRIPLSRIRAVHLAERLMTTGFARCDQLDEFVALVNLIEAEW